MSGRLSRLRQERARRQHLRERRRIVESESQERVRDGDVYIYGARKALTRRGSADAVEGHHLPPRAVLRRMGIDPRKVPVIALRYNVHRTTLSYGGNYFSRRGQARYGESANLTFADILIADARDLVSVDTRYIESIRELIDIYDCVLQNRDTYLKSAQISEHNVQEKYNELFGGVEHDKINNFLSELSVHTRDEVAASIFSDKDFGEQLKANRETKNINQLVRSALLEAVRERKELTQRIVTKEQEKEALER